VVNYYISNLQTFLVASLLTALLCSPVFLRPPALNCFSSVAITFVYHGACNLILIFCLVFWDVPQSVLYLNLNLLAQNSHLLLTVETSNLFVSLFYWMLPTEIMDNATNYLIWALQIKFAKLTKDWPEFTKALTVNLKTKHTTCT